MGPQAGAAIRAPRPTSLGRHLPRPVRFGARPELGTCHGQRLPAGTASCLVRPFRRQLCGRRSTGMGRQRGPAGAACSRGGGARCAASNQPRTRAAGIILGAARSDARRTGSAREWRRGCDGTGRGRRRGCATPYRRGGRRGGGHAGGGGLRAGSRSLFRRRRSASPTCRGRQRSFLRFSGTGFGAVRTLEKPRRQDIYLGEPEVTRSTMTPEEGRVAVQAVCCELVSVTWTIAFSPGDNG